MRTYNHNHTISQNEISELEGDKILGKTESELNTELNRYYRRTLSAVIAGKIKEVDSRIFISIQDLKNLVKALGCQIFSYERWNDRDILVCKKENTYYEAVFNLCEGYFTFYEKTA